MATLNEMIAQGAQFYTPDPVAQYNKMAQMQKYQQENELAKMKMEEYGRAQQESNALRQFLPGLNESNRSQLLGFGTTGQGIYKTLAEGDTQQRLRDQAISQTALHKSNILKNAIAQTRDAVAGIDPTDVESYTALRAGVLTQYPELAPHMPAAWNADVKQSLIVTAASVLEGQKPEPGFTLRPGETRFPRGYTGVATAPAAVAAAAVPPSVLEYNFAKTPEGGGFIGTYQDFIKAKADALRAPAAVTAPQALPTSVQEYEYAKTVPGGSFVGTYQDFVKAKADAARAPAPVVAPQALPASVLEYNFAKTPDGGGFVGTYQDFVQSKAEAGRAPVPITAPPTKVAEYEYAKTPAGGNYKGTYQQFLNLGKSEGSGGGAAKPPSGFRFTSTGDLEPIPGGPSAPGLTPKEIQKREASLPQARQSVKTVSNTMSVIGRTVDKLLANPDGINGITGLFGGITPALTDAARAAKADLEQLKNLAFVQGLTELRAASKTGAGVGNVSNREGDRFENLKASLDRSQSKEDLEASLRRLKAQSEFTIQTMQDAFDETYSYKNGETSTPSPAPGKPAPAALAPADKQALDWANANPKDPRSLQIKQRLGQ